MSELPPGLGSFAAGDLSFAVDDGYSLVPMDGGLELNEQALDQKLSPPEGAPAASWMLARLKRLSGGSLALAEEIEICDGAVFVIDFVVRKRSTPIGKIQLQAGQEGAALLGVVSSEPSAVLECFTSALMADPQEIAICRVRVRDPSWREDRFVEYGFDGSRYFS